MFDHLDRFVFFGGPVMTLLRPQTPPRDGLGVVLLSGDMGFTAGLSGQMKQRLVAAGYPVAAINALVFAADGRSPDEISALLSTTIHRLLATPGVRRVVLIGHSFGADLLHVGLVGLAPADRARVAAVILEVPTDKVYLTAGFREYFELGPPDVVALASASRLDWVPVTCIRGAAERTSLCPLLRNPNVRQVVLPGGHTLNRDGAALFAASYDAIRHHRR
ncbi:AcvB/VirJ family lysyl-phosphatidylglycerol hydrolase [Sphingomonas profundi]|uniref:AcvB/VirJ family lysyl-phosphatidylglycerol hydrolase n=1 Tax=Alterirhizorhabdus profundi TaxID=2681549 RepID=UPI0018D1C806|nr:AcvB/VirJ family lysyl-phosphatidylglycerol hydrolase [Sphingomonas profundi]